jgi:hypothetical protein
MEEQTSASSLTSEPTPETTFTGNSIDLTSFGALSSAILLLFLCLTCNMGFYCLPLIPLILGIVGVGMARQSANPGRTKTLSWISIGVGGVVILLIFAAIMAYFVLFGAMFTIIDKGSW